MTRTIKAQDVKPGMEIEWKFGGYYTRCVVGLVQRENLSYPAYSIRAVGSAAGWKTFSAGHEVTVLKEDQPDEPPAFGACVEVAGVKYVRCDDDELEWKSSDGDGWWRWSDLCDKGHVTVINPDPFATVQAEPEARKWDRWEDVPDMVVVCTEVERVVVRRNGDCIERLFADNAWGSSIFTANDLNFLAPFMEVL